MPTQVKTKTGRVVSDKMDKTIVVAVENVIDASALQEADASRPDGFRPTTRTVKPISVMSSRSGKPGPSARTKRVACWRLIRKADHTTA